MSIKTENKATLRKVEKEEKKELRYLRSKDNAGYALDSYELRRLWALEQKYC